LGGRGRQISEFEASLVYRVSSRTARATQRNLVSDSPPPPKKKKTLGSLWKDYGQELKSAASSKRGNEDCTQFTSDVCSNRKSSSATHKDL
jgi:hypothetical protein